MVTKNKFLDLKKMIFFNQEPSIFSHCFSARRSRGRPLKLTCRAGRGGQIYWRRAWCSAPPPPPPLPSPAPAGGGGRRRGTVVLISPVHEYFLVSWSPTGTLPLRCTNSCRARAEDIASNLTSWGRVKRSSSKILTVLQDNMSVLRSRSVFYRLRLRLP